MSFAPRETTPAYELPRKLIHSLTSMLARHTRAELRFDDGARALYATDASNYRHVPLGVVIPQELDEVPEIIAACREHELPLLTRGGGTSLAGQCCNTAVIIDLSKHCRRVLSIDPHKRTAIVEAGCVLDDLRNAAEQYHLTFGPDPSTHNHNTLGGMIGNNSCGVHSVMAGRTSQNVHALEIVTYEGLRTWVADTSAAELTAVLQAGGRKAEIYAGLKQLRDRYREQILARYPDIPRRVSGYNLVPLLGPNDSMHVARALVGSEGTCVSILRAELNLVPSPPARVLLMLGFDDVYRAADAVPEILPFAPIGLEGMDDRLVDYMRRKHIARESRESLPEGHGWLLVEFGADSSANACEQAQRALTALRAREKRDTALCGHKLVTSAQEMQRLWEVRKSGLGATARVPGKPDSHPGWEDSAVAPAHLGGYMRKLRALLDRYGYDGAMYGHFGDGCLHIRITSDLSNANGVQQWRHFLDEAADLVLACNGSLSGEHGDGQARGELLVKMFGEELIQAMREFKHLWDPQWKMNPGKVIDAQPIVSDLRTGPDVRQPHPPTAFAYADDDGDYTRAVLRCVGIGECRRESGTVMCPSYQATHEELHSTRGRARLLWEMLRGMSNDGSPLHSGWDDRTVFESLDLCLSCKGCRSECPVNVDMATYKAEFMHHYFAHRLRPRTAYSMGLIYYWSRLGSLAPGLVNVLTHTPLIGNAIKLAGGIAQARAVPRFGQQTFLREAGRGLRRSAQEVDVVLWPDTFSNHFRPAVLHSALTVFHLMGLRVAVPGKIVCCARPLFAEGMLELARSQLEHTLHTLEPFIRQRLPIVGLEPSCVASFRDELPNLFRGDDRAHYLASHVHTFAEFLTSRDFQVPHLSGNALVHMHCNHRAVMGIAADQRLLQECFDEIVIPEPGCCGMAGPFGFDSKKYEVSLRLAERALVPAVKQATAETFVVADGFSCREQILQQTGRDALHLSQVVDRALRTSLLQRCHRPRPEVRGAEAH